MLFDLPIPIIYDVLGHLSQNDVVSLLTVNKKTSEISLGVLYRSITITRTRPIRGQKNFLRSYSTYICGTGVKNSRDSNEWIVFLKIKGLLEAVATKKAQLIKQLTIHNGVLQDIDALNELIVVLNKGNTDTVIKSLDSRINPVSTSDNATEKVFIVPRYTEFTLKSDPYVSNLKIVDKEEAALRLVNGAEFPNLKRLSFNHVHGMLDYNTPLRELTCAPLLSLPLSQLTHLELHVGCQEPECPCMSNFFTELAPLIPNVTHLAIVEIAHVHDHYLTEYFDLHLCQFLLLLSKQLHYLSIRHSPPLNCLKFTNNVEGNYIRRRILYSNTLPKLTSLNTLIAPEILGSLSCYEILVSDLVWNGCECDHCTRVFPKVDSFLMDHGYYDLDEVDERDVLCPVLFGVISKILKGTIPNFNKSFSTDEESQSLLTSNGSDEWSDLDWLRCPVFETEYDFHHGPIEFRCFDDIKVCSMGQQDYDDLLVCIRHFFQGYSDWILKECPTIDRICMSGLWFDREGGET